MTTLFYCIAIFLTLSYQVAGECVWFGGNNPSIPQFRYCQSEPYEVTCHSAVTYKLYGCYLQESPDEQNPRQYLPKPDLYEYNIKITVVNPDENPLFKNLTLYTSLQLLDGYLVTIPKDVFQMIRLTSIRISGNKLRKINFNNFLPLSNLKKIDLANNTLIVIETSEDNGSYSAVLDIDLSLNSIETIPNNFLKGYRELEHLNISHNMISYVDKRAFEGLVQLKTLDLSHNKLKEVENIFAQLPKLVDINYAETQNLQKLTQLVLDDNFIADVNLIEFFETGIPQLSIGGNKIPCHVFARAKYSKYSDKLDRTVTAKVLNFNFQNMNGILCDEVENDIKDVTLELDNNMNSSILISSILKSLENNSQSINVLSEILNQSEKRIGKFIESTNMTLENITNQLKHINKE